nr:reverse transcriptase domain-containing protein [Tanacetum cinerariifolium]
MLHVPASISKKLKNNGTLLTAQAASRTLEPKSYTTQKTIAIRADAGSPKGAGQMMTTTSPNHGYVKKLIHLRQGSVTLRSQERTRMPVNIKTPKDFPRSGKNRVQKKYIKDLVEIHHIKQREGESMEAFMERFKAKTMHVSGAPECMKISGFMHGITNLDLIKKLNENIPKSVDEMMSVITAFLRGEWPSQTNQRKKVPPVWKHHESGHRPNFDKRLNFKNQHKSSRRQDRFTPLTKTLKEILAMDTVKFKAPLPRTGPAENRNKNKFCEFHREKGHSTDECIHLRRQIEEAVKSGQLLHPKIKNQMIPTTTPVLGFDGEMSWLLGQTSLMVTLGDEEHSASALMNFMIVRSPLPNNGVIGCPGLRKIQAVPSTAHEMLKFLVEGGIATIRSTTIIAAECKMVTEAQSTSSPKEPVAAEGIKITIHPEHDRRSPIHSGTQVECPRRMPTHKAKKKGAGTGQEQCDPRRSLQARGSENHEGGTLPRLALKSSPGKEARWQLKDVRRLHRFK